MLVIGLSKKDRPVLGEPPMRTGPIAAREAAIGQTNENGCEFDNDTGIIIDYNEMLEFPLLLRQLRMLAPLVALISEKNSNRSTYYL